MPLSTDNLIQTNGGSFVGTSGSATLGVATAAGNTVILVLAQSGGIVDPVGFTVARKNALIAPVGGVYWKTSAGGETSWTISPSGGTRLVDWVVYEVSGLDAVNPVDMTATPAATGTTASLSTGTAPMSGTFDGFVVAMHVCLDTTSPTPGTWSNHTNGLVEQTEIGGNDGTQSIGLSVSLAVPALSLAAWSCTADKTAPVGQSSMATIVVFTAAGAKRAADLLFCTGFEFNTTAGLTVGNAGTRVFDTIAGTPSIVTDPRTGTYSLELSSTAAAANLFLGAASGTLSLIPVGTGVGRFSFKSPTSLPAGDTILYTVEHSTVGAESTVIRYVSASQKIGVKVGSGTEVLSDTTIAADTWISIDYRVDARTTNFTCDWQVTYADGTTPVAQTQATMSGGTANIQHGVRLGWTDAVTRTIRFDDWVVAKELGHYPLGNYRHTLLKVDPAGTLTVSGVTTNFQTFTANGTLAAWDATAARDAIDEFPVVVGISADGFAQVANSTTAYVEIPMETFNVAALGGAVRGIRLLAPGWAATTVAASLGFRAWDGVTEHNVSSSGSDRNFDDTTTPAWCCRMVKGAARQDWTQAKLDALAFRIGFSNDTSPAIGIHAIYAEVAIRIGDLFEVSYIDPGYYVHYRQDPDSSGIIAMVVTVPAGATGATLEWSISGTPQTPVHIDGDVIEVVHEETIGATDIATVTAMTLIPD